MALVKDDLLPRIHGRVLIKPNFVCTSRQTASTHADTVRAVLDFVFQAKPDEVLIAEGAGPGNTDQGWKNFGYLRLVKEYPVALVDLNEGTQWRPVELLDGLRRPVPAKVNALAVESDCRISVAVAKTHDTAICTLSMKNMMGALNRADRGKMHGHGPGFEPERIQSVRVMPRNIVRLNQLLLPHIAVIDAFEAMEGDGPIYGEIVPLHAAVVSADAVAADAVATALMGFDPLDLGHIVHASQEGMGTGDLAHIDVVGDSVHAIARTFKPHPYYDIQKQWRG
jgi:uncharacterized protein (DUF362 family)